MDLSDNNVFPSSFLPSLLLPLVQEGAVIVVVVVVGGGCGKEDGGHGEVRGPLADGGVGR